MNQIFDGETMGGKPRVEGQVNRRTEQAGMCLWLLGSRPRAAWLSSPRNMLTLHPVVPLHPQYRLPTILSSSFSFAKLRNPIQAFGNLALALASQEIASRTP